jgi:hypothetical protein
VVDGDGYYELPYYGDCMECLSPLDEYGECATCLQMQAEDEEALRA